MNAIVTMPLSEIDALRGKLEQSEYRVSQLETTEKKIKVEIREQTEGYRTAYYGLHGFSRVESCPAWRNHPHTYINLDEVIRPIREEEESKVSDNTLKLEGVVKELKEANNKIKEKHNEYIKEIHASLDQLREQVRTNIATRNETEAYEAALVRATIQLFEMDNQTWWGRVFKPIKTIRH